MQPISTPPNTASTLSPTRSALKVLVLDDDPFQLEFIADLLRGLGASDVVTAPNGADALYALERSGSSPFNLMVCDLHMPGMDGFQFMANAAAKGFRGGLIIVSGQGETVMHSASLVAELRRFKLLGSLSKPVDKSELSVLLAKM